MSAALSNTQILLLEDDVNIGSTLSERLATEHDTVHWVQNCGEARTTVQSPVRLDLALLDIGLPDGSGLEIAKLLREKRRSTAVIFLTAMGDAEDRVRGLELGAEDYIVKPFHWKELKLRIQNVLKRARPLELSEPVTIGKAKIWFSRFEAISDEKSYFLTHKECAILKLLVEHAGQVVSRDLILSEVWASNEFPSSRTVDNFILKFRKWIEIDPEHPELIRNVRGIGYQLDLRQKEITL